jgi:hypothetical protein
VCPAVLAEDVAGVDDQDLLPPRALGLAAVEEHRVTGRVTVKNMLGEVATMQSTAPLSISFCRIVRSEPPASLALLAITKPARPVGFSAA